MNAPLPKSPLPPDCDRLPNPGRKSSESVINRTVMFGEAGHEPLVASKENIENSVDADADGMSMMWPLLPPLNEPVSSTQGLPPVMQPSLHTRNLYISPQQFRRQEAEFFSRPGKEIVRVEWSEVEGIQTSGLHSVDMSHSRRKLAYGRSSISQADRGKQENVASQSGDLQFKRGPSGDDAPCCIHYPECHHPCGPDHLPERPNSSTSCGSPGYSSIRFSQRDSRTVSLSSGQSSLLSSGGHVRSTLPPDVHASQLSSSSSPPCRRTETHVRHPPLPESPFTDGLSSTHRRVQHVRYDASGSANPRPSSSRGHASLDPKIRSPLDTQPPPIQQRTGPDPPPKPASQKPQFISGNAIVETKEWQMGMWHL